LLYALLDKLKTISVEHLEAALAVWRYNAESVEMLFGENSGDPLADRLYQLLASGPMKTKEFHRHVKNTGSEIGTALQQLERSGLIQKVKSTQTGRGRQADTWERSKP